MPALSRSAARLRSRSILRTLERDGQGAPFRWAELRLGARRSRRRSALSTMLYATTFLQTSPSLEKTSRSKIFGTGLPIALVVSRKDSISITVAMLVAATCSAIGLFDVLLFVSDRVRTDENGVKDSGIRFRLPGSC